MCPQSRSQHGGREKNTLPLPRNEFWFLAIPACVTILTELSRRRNTRNSSAVYIYIWYFVFPFSFLFYTMTNKSTYNREYIPGQEDESMNIQIVCTATKQTDFIRTTK